ncbi:MAG TPA: hypothetical protein VFG16_12200, partial [Streptomyces sp.]|nr:hypothetical protein [Streptomyces sp.]
MEPLQQDDPRRIGPYTALARFGESAVCVRYLAYGADGAVSVVSVARPEFAALTAFRSRFRSETRRTERLAGGWVAPIESRTDGDPMWTASPYVPALTLREAIALGGPLPERALRTLGAGLAETLSRAHAGGAVLHGLAPDTVLLAADGPRLTAFGALGAAAVAEAHPDGQLSVRLGYLTPEQASGSRGCPADQAGSGNGVMRLRIQGGGGSHGGAMPTDDNAGDGVAGRREPSLTRRTPPEPGPASDIFVLGLLLAYAATGTTPLGDADRIAHAEPELDGVPSELRSLVASCLAKLPEDRPSAGTVAAELALEGAAALARDGWLPPGLVQAVESQAAEVESLRSGGGPAQAGPGPTDAIPQQHAGGSQGTVGAPEGGRLVTGGDTLVVRGRGVDRATA